MLVTLIRMKFTCTDKNMRIEEHLQSPMDSVNVHIKIITLPMDKNINEKGLYSAELFLFYDKIIN